jgi:hypothetical protein
MRQKLKRALVIALIAVVAVAVVAGVALTLSLFGEHTPLAGMEFDRWCSSFAKAEKKFPDDPVRADDFVYEHHTFLWSQLMLLAAGGRGLFPGGRYPLVLRSARLHEGLPDWECPAMERVMLGVAERRPMPDEDLSKHPWVEVFRDGRITIDERPLAIEEIEPALRALKERDGTALLYREDWRTRPHPSAKRVLDAMVKLRFLVDLRPLSRAQEATPLPPDAKLRPPRAE